MIAGKYVAVADEYQWTRAKTGTIQLIVRFRILEGEYENKTVIWFGSFHEKTTERTGESLRYMGWDGDDLSKLGEVKNKVIIVVEEHEYGNKTDFRVAWVNPFSEGMPKMNNGLSEAEVRMFAASMKQRMAAIKKAPAQAPSAAAKQEDMPF